MAASVIEMLAAVLSGTRRREIHALLTTVYPIISTEESPIIGIVSVNDVRSLNLIFDTDIVSGSVSVSEIEKQTVLVVYEEEEKEVTGTVSVSEIIKTTVVVEYDEVESEITGTVSVSEITQTVVLVTAEETEKEITGTVSVSEITKV
jgi:hypothetical protein